MKRTVRAVALALSLVVGTVSVSADRPTSQTSDASVGVDRDKKTVTVPAKVAPRKLEYLKGEVYPIEVIACWAYEHSPKGQKAHETVVTIEARPSEVHKALEGLGLKPGKPAKGEGPAGTGPEVNVYLELPNGDGTWKRVTMDKVLLDPKTRKPFPKGVRFRFTGSAMSQPDPTRPDKVYGADLTGTLVAIFPVTDETVCQSTLTMKEEKYLKLEVNKDVVPKEGTAVRLVLEAVK